MIEFSIVDLMDEQKCYNFLVSLLHPNGLARIFHTFSE